MLRFIPSHLNIYEFKLKLKHFKTLRWTQSVNILETIINACNFTHFAANDVKANNPYLDQVLTKSVYCHYFPYLVLVFCLNLIVL